jgi:hypothetical protein
MCTYIYNDCSLFLSICKVDQPQLASFLDKWLQLVHEFLHFKVTLQKSEIFSNGMGRLHSIALIMLISLQSQEVWSRGKLTREIVTHTIEGEAAKQKLLVSQNWLAFNDPLVAVDISKEYSMKIQEGTDKYGAQFRQYFI